MHASTAGGPSWARPRSAAGAALALAAGLAVILAVLLGGARPAAAHAELLASDPPAGSPLASVPGEIVLLFSEAVDPAAATVQVLDGTGADLAAGAVSNRAGDPTSLVVPTTGGPAAPGSLAVVWTLVGADGHVMTGMVGYTVAAAAPAAPAVTPGAAGAEPAPVPEAAAAAAAAAADGAHLAERLASLARPTTYVGFALLLGLPLFLLVLWPAGAATANARALHLAGVLAGVAGGGLLLASTAVGLRREDGLVAGLGRAVDTHAGRWALVEVVLFLAVAGLGLALRRTDPRRRRRRAVAAGAGAAALLLAHGRVGHAGDDWFATLIHAIHVGAMSAWIGGLVGLLVVAVPGWSSKGVLKVEFHRNLRAFTRLAGWAVAALLWSGVLLLVDAWPGGRGFGGDYLSVLAVKLVAVAVALTAGYAGHRLVRQVPVRPRPARPPFRSLLLTRRVAAEIALTAAVLAATAVLAGTSPAA